MVWVVPALHRLTVIGCFKMNLTLGWGGGLQEAILELKSGFSYESREYEFSLAAPVFTGFCKKS